jgi:iron complex outermembrane receptor protein
MHVKTRILHHAPRFFLRAVTFCGTLLLAGTATFAAAAASDSEDSIEYLKSLKIEDLLQAEITSVSKKPEKLADAAAAVFVITAEDIERAGARSIPEALRMAPGLQVAQLSANKWVVSARGFGDLFSNKLLVMIDGRSVYTPLFSGVFWDIQDTLMEDIDRIEVIRGPGATLWGANAVNGVINIITKSAEQTRGTLVTAATGTRAPLAAGARVGDRIGDKGSYRLYAKADVQDGFVQPGGDDAHDGWEKLQSGFRADVAAGSSSSLTLQGDVYKGEEELTYSFPGLLSPEESRVDAKYWGGNLLTRWEMERSADTLISLQAYYDYSNIDAVIPLENRHTFDLDFQYRTMPTSFQEVIWGLGYRRSSDDIGSTDILSFNPESKSLNLYNVFLQDEIALVKDSWWLTLGSKLEHNDYSGLEVQPTIRLRWKPEERQTVWAAISRAVRTSSRADHDLLVHTSEGADEFGNRYRTAIFGRKDVQPEELVAYELGHRWSPVAELSVDTALFYNEYENLHSLDMGSSFVQADARSPYLVIPLYFGNGLSAQTHGLEILVTWQPVDFWKLACGYSYIQASFSGGPETVWSNQQFDEDDFPEHQFQLRSWLDLPANWSLDSELYYVDDLTGKGVDGYIRLDLRLGWQVDENLKLSLSGENLTDSAKMEYPTGNSIVGSEVPRQFFVKLTWSM